MTGHQYGTYRIADAQFNWSVVSDDFKEKTLGVLNEVYTSNVRQDTDDVSTYVRDKIIHVFNVVKAIYLHAAKTGGNVAMSSIFSIGCHGDNDGNANEGQKIYEHRTEN